MSDNPDLIARLRCLGSLLHQLNARTACEAVNEAIEELSSLRQVPEVATPAQAGAELPELRWLTRPGWDGPERVLQYKNRKDDWEDVPEVK